VYGTNELMRTLGHLSECAERLSGNEAMHMCGNISFSHVYVLTYARVSPRNDVHVPLHVVDIVPKYVCGALMLIFCQRLPLLRSGSVSLAFC